MDTSNTSRKFGWTTPLYTDEMLRAVDNWSGIMEAPSTEARKFPKGIRVFRNSVLEFGFARAHPVIPGLWVLPLATWSLWKSVALEQSPLRIIGICLLGVLTWTLTEYALHMIWFHRRFDSEFSPKVKFTQFVIHGYHHEFPNDPGRLVMPISISWPLAAAIGGTLRLLFPETIFWSLFAGLLLGYLGYDWMHYYTHHFRPTKGIGKYLREFHMIHHYKDPNHNFGLSSPLWDWIFGKAIEPKTKLGRRED